ncbi:MAG: metal ABC transporter permease [Verrucomicrobiota bacterium]
MMTWYAIDSWIVIVGLLAAISCALLGNFLVLRKMSMMGDAISHAVLPGLAIAFFITEARASVTMFIGAAIVGILTAVFTQWVTRFGKVDEGASMGIVFTTLFALGLLLIVQAADHVELDPGCVLYGAIELTPLDVVWQGELFGLSIGLPRAVLVLGAVCVANLLFIVLFFKELRIASFDPELATTLGISANWIHYLLMTMVAVTTVAAFEAVGSIIVIAMLIVPAAAAHLLTDRLGVMIVLSVFLAGLSAVLGHFGALLIPPVLGFESTSTSGMMAVMTGVLFAAAFLFSPRYGLLVRKLGRTDSAESTV